MNEEEFEKYTCPCCFLPSNVQSLSFRNATLQNIGRVSLRMKEYFQILLFFITVFVILFLFNSVPLLIANPSIGKCVFSFCSQNLTELSGFYSSIYSNTSFAFSWIDIMLLVSLVIIFGFKYWFVVFLIQQNKEHNKMSTNVAKYSIHASNLQSSSIQEIKQEVIDSYNALQLLDEKGERRKISEENIIEVSRVQNTNELYHLMIGLVAKVKQLKIMRIRTPKKLKKIENVSKKIDKIKSKILSLKNSNYTREAFIIFDCESIPKQLETTKWKRFYKKYVINELFFATAVEPIDIIWENFTDSEQKRVLKILFSYLAALFILFRNITTQSINKK